MVSGTLTFPTPEKTLATIPKAAVCLVCDTFERPLVPFVLHCLIKFPVNYVPLYESFLLTLSNSSPVNYTEDTVALDKLALMSH